MIAAFPEAKQRVPGLRMIVVAGPRIDPGSLPAHDGLEVRPYVHELYRHLAVCDLAVVQGGLTTAMELTASRRPFLYFPLRHHFEQNLHVRHRLERYRAGRCMDYQTAGPAGRHRRRHPRRIPARQPPLAIGGPARRLFLCPDDVRAEERRTWLRHAGNSPDSSAATPDPGRAAPARVV